ILINTSRGEVVDNKSLKAALQNKMIKAASLDVWENEPDIDTELMELLFTATPHIAGYSLDGKANGTWMSVQAIGKKFNLPCKDWKVTEVPLPAQPVEFSIDLKDKNIDNVLDEAILYTYDIFTDDRRFRENPLDFELQRADYPIRREFPAFTLTFKNTNEFTGNYKELISKIKQFGYICI
ncbi:MAG: DUF3410 domain-containing protein, partial [Bacteroidaceae bacterium]|nr:DUF3410 domain-containing protein [Bacteroidaceae bacterium]